MNVQSLTSGPVSPHAYIANVSSLFGITVFLQWMWERAALEHTLFTAVGSGLAVYLILAVGYAAAQGVIQYGPSLQDDDSEPNPDPDDADEQAASEPTEPTPEPQTQAA